MLIALLKAHGIKKAVISPGMKNYGFVGSLQSDDYFELYSCVDERSAAYMACGLAQESGEPVVLSCTGATASRNYLPGLTEAFYRKLPILAVTSMTHTGEIGQLIPQVLDRRVQMNDAVNLSVQIPLIRTQKDEWADNILINKAILQLKRNGGGPVHINLETECDPDFSVKVLPDFRVIHRFKHNDELPEIREENVAVFVGVHRTWSDSLTEKVDEFCEKYNGVVLCDQTSNYKGRYGVLPGLLCCQEYYDSKLKNIDLLIHIGEISGSYLDIRPSKVWRVNPDGEIRDTFQKLDSVFEMEEEEFFSRYTQEKGSRKQTDHYEKWTQECEKARKNVPELPFSNGWIASALLPKIHEGMILHLAILNSLRMWDLFEAAKADKVYSNTGGFGIDGILSAAIGTALANPKKLHVVVVGDLAFFYDMNSLGNRHVPDNLRILVINNGGGAEFRNYRHPVDAFGEDADPYMAAAGHNGDRSRQLLKHYVSDLGYRYMSAENKQEFLEKIDIFMNENEKQKMVFEVFTEFADEKEAYKRLCSVLVSKENSIKKSVKDILGEEGTKAVKKALGRK